MTGPVWDGTGVDPWLPTRLRLLGDIAAAERHVYDSYWARLSSWLVTVARNVLRPGRAPDPLGVYAAAPDWAREVADFSQSTVRQVMGDAYARVMGPGWGFDSRPAVAAHLAAVRNRMVRTPDEVFDLVASHVAEGAAEGESIPDIAERVESILSATETETWRNRAVVVARTETMGAVNAARDDSWAALSEELTGDPASPEYERVWLATADHRTRETHREAEGQRRRLGVPFSVGGFPLARPGDPAGPAGEVIQCRCTTVLLERGEPFDLTNRRTRRDTT